MVDWKNEYLAQDITYFDHVSKFVDYLLLPAVQKDNQPASISEEDIDKCIGYYVSQGQILSVGSMESHLESIKAFYNFLIQKNYVKECPIISAHYTEFKANLSDKYNLKEPKERTWIGNDDVKMILDRLDSYFDNSDYDKMNDRKKSQFVSRLSLRIYIKLSLIAPAKKAVLLALRFCDFDDEYRNVNINAISIKIPNGLRHDITYAFNFVNEKFNKSFNSKDNLFDYLSDVGDGTKLNLWFYTFLKENNFLDVPENTLSYPVEIINITAIMNLVRQGTNPAYISQLSGITIGSLEKKYYKVYSESLEYKNKMNKEINSEISKIDYYNYI